ncbi:hypothetical protein BKA93DRAFT_782371 [Sparassis latifolia]
MSPALFAFLLTCLDLSHHVARPGARSIYYTPQFTCDCLRTAATCLNWRWARLSFYHSTVTSGSPACYYFSPIYHVLTLNVESMQ